MSTCPVVVTRTGLTSEDPCNGRVCFAWYAPPWHDAAQRELAIADQLAPHMTDEERTALANAKAEYEAIPSVWFSLVTKTVITRLATVAKALRCLWWGVAARLGRKPPDPPQLPQDATKTEVKEAAKSWWHKFLPELGNWAPSLSWPDLPGVDIPFDRVWAKLKAWFEAAIPWVIGGVALWLFAPTIVRSLRSSR